MSKNLTDNMQWTSLQNVGLEDNLADLQRIANISIGDLNSNNDSSLLVFPQSFNVNCDGIEENNILSLRDNEIATGNIMGFIGINDTMINIKSRFSKSDLEDYFLHYMLQKVFCINLFDMKHTTSTEPIFDFLLYMFPSFLKKALRQGLFKKYQHYQHCDANLKGPISISRHIRMNIPFNGKIAYDTREHSYDNDLTQLVRHTIEYIRTLNIGKVILQVDSETRDCVAQIVNATPSYSLNARKHIVNKNLRPLIHPFFYEYAPLQKICMQILMHDSIKYGKEKDRVYGILFDGAWLWEEYLNTILIKEDFIHPRNKENKGGIRMFDNQSDENFFDRNNRRLYPDFYKKNEYILDAKYKHLNYGVDCADLYQVVTYMYCMNAPYGGYAYPIETENPPTSHKLAGNIGGIIHIIPLYIPQKSTTWNEFLGAMKKSEQKFISSLYPNTLHNSEVITHE